MIDKILSTVLVIIAVFLTIALITYFFLTETAFDGSWNHTYFPGSILLFCVLGLIGFFTKNKKVNIEIKTEIASIDSFMEYILEVIKKGAIKKDQEMVRNYIYENFENMKLSFVFKSGKVLIVNNVPDLIEKVIKKYLNTKD